MALPFDPLSLRLAVLVQLVIALLSNISGSYAYNICVFIILLWAYFSGKETEPLVVGTFLLCFSIILDIIVLAIYAKDILDPFAGQKAKYTDTAKFCVAMVIMNLILKPWSIVSALREYKKRGGALALPSFNRGGADGSNSNATSSQNYAKFHDDAPVSYQGGSSEPPTYQPPYQPPQPSGTVPF
eukprot:m.52273 g.52273  ORF g.52273 m.52273 type:complete len:185 (-) comp48429_c0_seq1:199-753(-)